MDLNTICQIIYPVLWLTASFLITNHQRRVGFVFGILSMPLAMYSFAHSGLWGSFLVEVVATAIFVNGAYRAYMIESERWR